MSPTSVTLSATAGSASTMPSDRCLPHSCWICCIFITCCTPLATECMMDSWGTPEMMIVHQHRRQRSAAHTGAHCVLYVALNGRHTLSAALRRTNHHMQQAVRIARVRAQCISAYIAEQIIPPHHTLQHSMASHNRQLTDPCVCACRLDDCSAQVTSSPSDAPTVDAALQRYVLTLRNSSCSACSCTNETSRQRTGHIMNTCRRRNIVQHACHRQSSCQQHAQGLAVLSKAITMSFANWRNASSARQHAYSTHTRSIASTCEPALAGHSER